MTGDQTDDVARVRALLREHTGAYVAEVQPLAGGFFSRAFAAAAEQEAAPLRQAPGNP